MVFHLLTMFSKTEHSCYSKVTPADQWRASSQDFTDSKQLFFQGRRSINPWLKLQQLSDQIMKLLTLFNYWGKILIKEVRYWWAKVKLGTALDWLKELHLNVLFCKLQLVWLCLHLSLIVFCISFWLKLLKLDRILNFLNFLLSLSIRD